MMQRARRATGPRSAGEDARVRAWPTLRNTPTPPPRRGDHTMATADGSVWGFGGSIGRPDSTRSSSGSDELLKLDLQERQWHNVTTPGPRPSARYGHAMATAANGTPAHHEEAPEKSAAALLHPFKALLAVMVSTLLSCCLILAFFQLVWMCVPSRHF